MSGVKPPKNVKRERIDGRLVYRFVDGAVSKRVWNKADVRVLHLLKETTNKTGRIGPGLKSAIRCGLTKQRHGKPVLLWKVCARRSLALQRGLPSWREIAALEDEYGEALLASATVNLNDLLEVGRERYVTSSRELRQAASNRWSARKGGRRSKILRLEPTIIVCGGTFKTLKHVLEEKGEDFTESRTGGYLIWEGIPCIAATHPSAPGVDHANDYRTFRRACKAGLKAAGVSLV